MQVAIPGTQTQEQATFKVITQAAFNNLIRLKNEETVEIRLLDILADTSYTHIPSTHIEKAIQSKIEKLPADVLKKASYIVTDIQLSGSHGHHYLFSTTVWGANP